MCCMKNNSKYIISILQKQIVVIGCDKDIVEELIKYELRKNQVIKMKILLNKERDKTC